MIDFDREYDPDEFDQLAKDLVAARGEPLDTFEKASLKRWKRDGMSARIRHLPDRRLSCWPTDLPTNRGPSYFQGRPMAPRDVMRALRGEQTWAISVGIRFDKPDLDVLRAAALTEQDKMFSDAAAALERNSYLVVQCMSAEELKDIIARFAQVGVTHLTLDDLRVGEKKPVRL